MGDMLSQDEINALLGGIDLTASSNTVADSSGDATILTSEQKDTLGEIGNISMGTSATTLFALLGVKVLITTPIVTVMDWKDLSALCERPCVGISVGYKEGIEGSNLLILQERDVKVISNLMMGGDGTEDIDGELNEIDMSAISEAMNQMVGSSATSLSSLVKMRIDIDTPHAFKMDFSNDSFFENITFTDREVVCIKFRMEIGTLIDSEIMQILPMSFALDMVNIMRSDYEVTTPPAPKEPEKQPLQQSVAATPVAEPQMSPAQQSMYQQPPYQQPMYQQPPYQQPMYQPSAYTPEPMHMPQPSAFQQNINAQPAQFQNFDVTSVIQQKENIDIIMDVPLEVTVELGRTSKKIKEILEFSPGTIIELNKLAGEPVDILVNGKYIANGEVVVIDENFAIRVTDILSAEQRI